MKQKLLLSVVISAFNEEKKIEDCLKSASFADEIIFVDNGSTDRTREIASKYTSKIFIRANKLMLNINKNFGFSKAKGEWVFSLDADERISEYLQKEIVDLTKHSGRTPQLNGYFVPRKNIIFGKWIKHTGWYPDNQLRLFKKGKGKFPEEHVHEMIKVEGNTGHLNQSIVHYNYETIFQFMQKLVNIYAPNEAEQLLKNGYKFNWQDSIRFPIKEFLSRFFVREGYKDGFHGLMLSILMAFYHFMVFATIWEKYHFKEIGDKNILSETQAEFKSLYREILFWFNTEKIKSINNPIKKFIYYLLSKLHLL